MAGNLAAKFAANRAAAPSDKNYFTLHIAQNGIQVHANRLAPKQILHFHIPQLAHIHFAVYQLIHARQGTQLTVGFLAYLQDFAQFRAGNRGHGNDNFIDIIDIGALDNFIPASGHPDSLDISSPFPFIVIYNTADDHGAEIAVYDFFNNHIGRFPCPDYHDGNAVFLILLLML